jgi:hypothetical protein
MDAYRETFRRHRLLYLLPAVIAAIAVGALTYKSPSYVSSASLWVDNQVSAPSSLSVGPGEVQPQTPSAAEQTVLNELLTTTAFDAAIATGAGLGHVDPTAVNSPLIGMVMDGVTSTTPGPQILQLTATESSPTVARNIVKSVITQLQSFSQRWAHDFASSAVAYYQAQVTSATRDLAEAKAGAGPDQRANINSAASALASATTSLSQAQAAENGQNAFTTVSVLDQPTLNPAPTSGLKSPLIKAFAGAVAGLLVSLLVLVLRTPGGSDKWDDEVSDSSLIAAVGMGAVVRPWEPVRVPSSAHPAAPAPVTHPAPTGTAARATPPAQPAASAPATPTAPTEPVLQTIQQGGRRRRKTVSPQPLEHAPDSSVAAENGRA